MSLVTVTLPDGTEVLAGDQRLPDAPPPDGGTVGYVFPGRSFSTERTPWADKPTRLAPTLTPLAYRDRAMAVKVMRLFPGTRIHRQALSLYWYIATSPTPLEDAANGGRYHMRKPAPPRDEEPAPCRTCGAPGHRWDDAERCRSRELQAWAIDAFEWLTSVYGARAELRAALEPLLTRGRRLRLHTDERPVLSAEVAERMVKEQLDEALVEHGKRCAGLLCCGNPDCRGGHPVKL